MDENGPLRIMYRVDGSETSRSTRSTTSRATWVPPVRIGNGASSQLQLDTYGEMMDAIWHAGGAAGDRAARVKTSSA
jgi:GH15 family glucan-1,4-alpha-glucosidase